ncbi:MAG: nucleotidyltransferase domain-containing protein [Candidatus Omnitrophota bacterium]
MKNNFNNNIFCATNSLKVLSFLVDNPNREFLGSEIQKATGLSRAGIYIALKELIKEHLITKIKKGKLLIYSLIYDNPANKQFKALKNVINLNSLVLKINPFANKIVLFGSAARGEDNQESDIDLFILSNQQDEVWDILNLSKSKRKIQAVVKSPSEFVEFAKKEKVFCSEIDRGIALWEKKQ